MMKNQVTEIEKKSPPFTQIPDHWEPLIGYEFRMINRDGTPALDKRGKPKMGHIDLYDLMVMDAMRSYKERAKTGERKCYIESEQLAIKIGLRGEKLKKVCDRVLQLMHLGWIKATPEIYGATQAVRLVWEVDTALVEDVAEAIAKERRTAKLLAVKNGDSFAFSKQNMTLKEYVKEYLSEYLKEQVTEDGEEHLLEQLPEQEAEKVIKYVSKNRVEESAEHGTEQVPEDVGEQSPLTPVDADCGGADDIHISDFPVQADVQSNNDVHEVSASSTGNNKYTGTMVPDNTQDAPTPEAMQRYIIDYLIGLDPDSRDYVSEELTWCMGRDITRAYRHAEKGNTTYLQRGYEYIMQLSMSTPTEADTEPGTDAPEEQEASASSMSNADNWELPDIIAEIDRTVKDLPGKGIPRTHIAEAIKGVTGGNANYNIIQDETTAWIVLAELRTLY